MYIVSLHYKKPIEVVNALGAAHVAYLDRYYRERKFIVSGAKVPRTGGAILVRDMPRDELNTILSEDPFFREGIADYEVTEFMPAKYDAGFKKFI